MFIRSLTIFTDQYNQYQVITGEIELIVAESEIKNGVVTIQTKHTTTGVTVNESLECLESDINDFLKRLVPEEHPYAHARMLKDYGSTAGNPTGHIKALLTGNHCHFPIIDGKIVRGGAQEVYFCEFDGPSERTVLVYIQEG
ncbi:MAG: secondary thiamine-phosphate synthase enzyme YjbQ [Bacillus sp. (in: Bacteria)]|nr:secondary thiamine-phosphate synthase enzyme YjbQ [Bacillus sp. (in: firmicutes)]